MASDSDEEDRLLQMALKEQEERDVRPARSSKPVVNMVQQPPQRHNQRNAGSNPKTASRGNPVPAKGRARPPSRGGDDDDDSEVELLSISSGDEDSSTKDRIQHVRTRTAGSDRRSSRGDDADLGWDDDEPRSWKKVDEAELARRVREMREMRAAPGAQAIDQKAAAIARKGLTNIQSLPKGVEVLDPLGLGVIDNKSLRLITDNLTSTPRDKSELDPATREKVLYSSPNFDPKAFLARVHQETSAADLESGALTLKTDLKGRTQQKKQLVKENFDCFVSCKTTIDDIESKLRQIEEDPDGAGTGHLYDVTQNISAVANRAFQPLFERQAQADKIRSVQGMLQRFRTLFNLPSSIRGSIRKGEYDLAVREYRKAKSIVLPSHVGILKRVLEEVEKVMQEFKGMLYKNMEDPQLDLAELENIVRLLLELEPDSDPVWHYLNIQNRKIRGSFEKCSADHDARIEALQNEFKERLQSDARWRQLQQDTTKSLEVDSMIEEHEQVDPHMTKLMSAEADTLRGKYIHRLTAVLLQQIPTFWRLVLSVFSGKFAKSTAGNNSEANGKQNGNNKSDETKYSNHTLEEVGTMVNSTLSLFDSKVQSTFRDFDESNILSSYMGDAIKEISKACFSLQGKDSSPPSAVKILRGLQFEMTKIYILRLCSWMRSTTREISNEETWITLTTLERNKSPYAISFMPLEFREMTISAMDRIDIMIQTLRNETSKLYDISEPLHEIQESVRLAFLNSFLDFAGYLERLGGEVLAESIKSSRNKNIENGYMHGLEREVSPKGIGEVVVDSHKKMLIVLSNIGFCKDELSKDLYSKYSKIWSRERDDNGDMRDLTTSFSALEEKVLEQYTFSKSNMIRNAALNYLLDSGVQWGSAPPVKGIRDATIELLHIIVSVHAEVYSGAKPLLERTLVILVQGLIDTFLSAFHENKSKDLKSLDSNGFCQLMLELDYFETVLSAYFSSEAHQALNSLKENLLDKACESATSADENPGHNRRATRGSDDPMADERSNPSVSADDLLQIAQQCSNDILEGELERTRLNISCFMESSLQPNPGPVPAQPRPVVPDGPVNPRPVPVYPSFQGGAISSPSFRRGPPSSTPGGGSPAVSRRRR